MYNSYYNFIPATALYNMPQIEPMPRDEIGLDIAELYYKDTKNDMKIEFSLISFNNEKKALNLRHYSLNHMYDWSLFYSWQ